MITLEELENRLDMAQSTLNTMQEVVAGLKDNLEELKEEHKEPEFDLYDWNPCTTELPAHVKEDIMCDWVSVMLMHKDVYNEYRAKNEYSLPIDADSVLSKKLFIGYLYQSITGKLMFKYPNGTAVFDENDEDKLDPKDWYFKYIFGYI